MNENEIIKSALNIWANYLETENIALGAKDIEAFEKVSIKLNPKQEMFVNKLRIIANKY